MVRFSPRRGWWRFIAPVTGLCILIAFVPAAAVAGTPPGGDECPVVYPKGDLQVGAIATGYTVVSGTEPETFEATILGIEEDAIAPGRDLIIIEASSPAIDENGIWYGMSGSPIYLDDQLVGAVSYRLSYSTSTVAGVTPAQDMVDILSYPESSDLGEPDRVRLSASSRRSIAEAVGVPESEVGGSMSQLKVPLAVSGLSDHLFEQFVEDLGDDGASVMPYSSGSATEGSSDPLLPGDNLSVTISYGDITQSGVGTVSFVCDGKLVGFGHSFYYYDTDNAFGVGGADAITIVPDEYGAYKLANVTEPQGTLIQDRLAGVVGDMSAVPTPIPITSTITALNTGKTIDGETNVLMSEDVPYLAYYHGSANTESAFDQYGLGNSTLTWTVTGATESGDPFSLTRENMFSSDHGITFHPFDELNEYLRDINRNKFEEVTFTGVDMTSTVDDEFLEYRLKVKVRKNGEYRKVSELAVSPHETISIKAILQPRDARGESSPLTKQVLKLKIEAPGKKALKNHAKLEVSGGAPRGEHSNHNCAVYVGDCRGSTKGIGSFEELLSKFESNPANNDVLAFITTGRHDKVKNLESKAADQLVRGGKTIRLRYDR